MLHYYFCHGTDKPVCITIHVHVSKLELVTPVAVCVPHVVTCMSESMISFIMTVCMYFVHTLHGITIDGNNVIVTQ